MEENQRAEELKTAGIPSHPKWTQKTDFGEYGTAVYWYSNWDVGPEDYGGEAEKYDHVRDHMHGFSVELRHDENNLWSASLSTPTPWGENHESIKSESKRMVSLNEALEHINHLLSAGPAGEVF